ncbi:MAG: nucleotide exchange factor GrpE [Clostridia bacterium]|nr:nucleotide exchange factor GrpE [Clostridia bacterium]
MAEKKKKVEKTEDVAENKELCEALAKIEELEKKHLEEQDKYLRVLAEYDNFRKRTVKERDSIYSDAYIDCVKQLLPVIDNIDRVTTLEADASFMDGLKLIVNSVHQTLEKMGVTEIETKTFDPNLHNAVMHIDDEAYGEGEIVEVFQKGYALKDRVIRYAMVKVAN